MMLKGVQELAVARRPRQKAPAERQKTENKLITGVSKKTQPITHTGACLSPLFQTSAAQNIFECFQKGLFLR